MRKYGKMKEKEQDKKLRRREYDESWKHVLEKYLWEFLEFYFPKRLEHIDKSKGYKFLDQELDKIMAESEAKKRRVDKLVEVYTKKEPIWVLIHIEVQTYPEEEFPKRMFTYYYRIFERFKKPLASLAILADQSPTFRPSTYTIEALGRKYIHYEFEIFKLLDLKTKEEELKKDPNIFAIVSLAHIKSWEKDYNSR